MTITATAPRAAAYRGKLRWWTELPLVAVIYALYSAARLMVRGDVNDAVKHGADILHFEQFTHLDPEHFFNRLFTHHAFLGVPADFAYASLHYVITPSVLVWLWLRRPTHYRMARTWLLVSTMIGLLGFTLVPTAPPRLLPGGHGFIDTMAQYGSYGWWGTDASAPRGLGHLTNQYAAMPSLHVGWSLWCGIILWRYGRHRVVRCLGLLYPMVTALVVMGTANHYLMDAAAGVATMGIGFLLAKPLLRLLDRVEGGIARTFGRGAVVPGPRGSEAEVAPEVARDAGRGSGRDAGRGSAEAAAGAEPVGPEKAGPEKVGPEKVGAERPEKVGPERVRASAEGEPAGSEAAVPGARTTVPRPLTVPSNRKNGSDDDRIGDGGRSVSSRMS
ncbi:phosphatase PAP2 family protein [Streptomyces sp. NBC_01190]|uniref:phosphatase PAP2 family protein n=1 Tax=Streptomyces sp. NBC_01190 TaxID=2903767 RepID=UPI003868A758|nr:phosphatase PAP2 family protein [Streptomyces sp. NBC_01190]